MLIGYAAKMQHKGLNKKSNLAGWTFLCIYHRL